MSRIDTDLRLLKLYRVLTKMIIGALALHSTESANQKPSVFIHPFNSAVTPSHAVFCLPEHVTDIKLVTRFEIWTPLVASMVRLGGSE